MAAQEQQAGMAQAAQGVPPGIGGTMAAATDTGAVDPAQLAAAASGGLAGGAPGAVEQVSESAGVSGLGV
jgi:hypothetical protein